MKVGVCLFCPKNHDVCGFLKCNHNEPADWYKIKSEYFDYNNLADCLKIDVNNIALHDYAYIEYINGKVEINMRPNILNDEEIRKTIIKEYELKEQEIIYYPDYSLIKPMRSWVHVKKER